MSRSVPTHAEVDAVLQHFAEAEGAVLLSEPGFGEELRTALRVTLRVALSLQTIGDDPAKEPNALDMLRDDIRAAIEFFEHVESIAWGVAGIPRSSWPWPAPLSWHELRVAYTRDLDVLRAQATSLPDRYAALVRLARIQLIIWGMTFGLTSDGYIG